MAGHPPEHPVSALACPTTSSPTAAPEFLETQPQSRFVIVVCRVMCGLMFGGALLMVALMPSSRGEPSAYRFLPLIPWAGGLATICLYIQRTRLVTRLKGGVLSLSGPTMPFLRTAFQGLESRRIAVQKIVRVRITAFHPGVDGVWGSRAGEAVQVLLRNDDEICIGTARPEELLSALVAAGVPVEKSA